MNKVVKSLMAGSMVAVFAAVMACSSESGKQSAHDHAKEEKSSEATASVVPQFSDEKVKAVYEQYVLLKDALVKSDAKEAKTAAAALQSALTKAGNTTGADLAGKIAGAATIDAERAPLNALSAEVEKLIKATKLTSGVVYKQFCPMANNGDGGYWLASEKDIKNPYYGDEMLNCGNVDEEIK